MNTDPSPTWIYLEPEKFLARIAHLSPREAGAYTVAFMHYCCLGPLADGEKGMRRLMKMDPDEWEESKAQLLRLYTANGDGTLHDPYADSVVNYRNSLIAKRKAQTLNARQAQMKSPVTHPVTPPVTGGVPAVREITLREEMDRIMQSRKDRRSRLGPTNWPPKEQEKDKAEFARMLEIKRTLGIQY